MNNTNPRQYWVRDGAVSSAFGETAIKILIALIEARPTVPATDLVEEAVETTILAQRRLLTREEADYNQA